jgi:hypothetical protein
MGREGGAVEWIKEERGKRKENKGKRKKIYLTSEPHSG